MSKAIVTIMGNVGNCELRDAGGTPVLSFSVATSKKDKNGSENCTWWNCSLFGQRASKLAPHVTKGKAVFVSGEVQLRKYETSSKAGQSLEVNVAEFDFAGKKDDGASRSEAPADTGNSSGGGGAEDDIPFSFIGDAAERLPKWERF